MESGGGGAWPPPLTLAIPARAPCTWPLWASRQATFADDIFGIAHRGLRIDIPRLLSASWVPPALQEGLRRGHKIVWTGCPLRTLKRNYVSCHTHAEAAGALFDSLHAHGWLEGPLVYTPHTVSAIACIVKLEPYKVRLVVDSTRAGLNDLMARLPCLMDDIDAVVPQLRRGDWLSKLDIADAFYCWPLAPEDCDFMGVRHPRTGEAYRFRFCAMGTRQSPAVQQAWALAIKAMLNLEGLTYCDPLAPEGSPTSFSALGAFLDDFLLRHAAHLTEWEALLQFLSALLRLEDYGIPVKWSKNAWPARAQEYTGLLIDTLAGTLSLTPTRRERLRATLRALLPLPARLPARLLRGDVASTTGKLQFACFVVLEGQAHLLHLYTSRDCLPGWAQPPSLRAAWQPDVECTLSCAGGEELAWWLLRLARPCTRRLFWETEQGGCLWSTAHLPRLPPDDTLDLFTGPFEVVTSDASGLGGGAWWRHERLHHTFTAEERTGAFNSSNMRELAMAPVGAHHWAEAWRDRRVLWRFDNQAAVGAINKRASMAPHFNALVLDMLAATVPRGIEVLARYIPGELNTLADGISRLRGARDDQDWQFDPIQQHHIAAVWGPFDVDACADATGTNAFCPRFWSEVDSCLDHRWAGLHVWCNPPFRAVGEVLRHFWANYADAPDSTSAVFVLPAWLTQSWWRLTAGGALLRFYPAGSDLFTSPSLDPHGGAERRVNRGPTHWPVVVLLFPRRAAPDLARGLRDRLLPRMRGHSAADALLLQRLSDGHLSSLLGPSSDGGSRVLPVPAVRPPGPGAARSHRN